MAKLSMKKKTKSKKSLYGSVKRQTSQKKLKIRKSSNRSKKTGTKKTKKGGANLAGRIKSRQGSLKYFDEKGPMNILMYKMQKEQVTGAKLEEFIDGHGGAELFINAKENGDPEKFTPIEFVFFVLMRSPMTAPDPQRCLDYINVLLKKNVILSARLVKAARDQLISGGALRPSNNQQSFEEAKKNAAQAIVDKVRALT